MVQFEDEDLPREYSLNFVRIYVDHTMLNLTSDIHSLDPHFASHPVHRRGRIHR